jgi:hypothetical protein
LQKAPADRIKSGQAGAFSMKDEDIQTILHIATRMREEL